jgi:hypothetical protein
MLGQICEFLAVDSSNFPSNEHIVIGNRSCQGGFLIHYFLNLCQKQNRPVLFIGLSQSLSHYNTVGQKLGNINKLNCFSTSANHENDSFIYINGLQLLGECIGPCSPQISEQNPFATLLKGDSTPLFELISESFERLAALAKDTDQIKAPAVIIDDLSILHSAGVATGELLILVNKILEVVTSGSTTGSLITLFHLDKEDEKAEEIWAFLSHLSTLQIEVSDLQSGYCKDVHGQVLAQWRDAEDKPRLPVIKHAQFKLSDKDIDLFAPGMSAAVL